MDPQLQTPPPQPPQSPPPVSSENSSRSFWKTLAIGMSIVSFGIALAVSGYLLVLNKNSEPEQIACTMDAKICPDGTSVGRIGPKCEFSPCPTPTIDPTANWQTYYANGFSFKYPPDWTIEKSSSQIAIKRIEHLKADGPWLEQDYLHRITVSMLDRSSSLSLKEILEKIYSNDGVLLPLIIGSAKETKLDGKEALEFAIPGAGGYFTEGILVTSMNRAYHIETLGLSDTSIGFPEVYRTILSTFQFTN